MKCLNYLIDCILYQIFKIILNIFKKKHGEKTNNPSIRKCINKLENKITFKVKTENTILENLIPKTMKLPGRTKTKITKNKNGQNVPHLEISEVVLAHCNIVNNDYQQDLRVLFTFILVNRLVNYYIFLLNISYSLKTLIQNFHTLTYGLLIKLLNC